MLWASKICFHFANVQNVNIKSVGFTCGSLNKINFMLQLVKKNNNCHTYYFYKVDLDLRPPDQLNPVDGYVKHLKNFVLYCWIRHGPHVYLITSFCRYATLCLLELC